MNQLTKFYFQFVLVVALIANAVTAQTYTGFIKNKKTNEPLSFVNIGVPRVNYGALSNEEGVFTLKFTSEKEEDTVVFSLVGYEPVLLLVKKVKEACTNNQAILLTEKIYQLSEVTVRPNDYVTQVMGTKKDISKLECLEFTDMVKKDTAYIRLAKEKNIDPNSFGFEIGNRFKIDKGQSTFIDKIQFKICNTINDTVIYRLNVYYEGKVKERMYTPFGVIKLLEASSALKKSIIIKVTDSMAVYTADLTPYNLEVTDDFVVALECLYASNKKMKLGAEAGFISSSTDLLFRSAVMSEWIKIPILDLSFFGVTVSYKKKPSFWKRLWN